MRANVYVGVDCFGRGCFGGGGFNTDKALALIRKHNFSAAIFAPGWPYEQIEDKTKAEYDANLQKYIFYCFFKITLARKPSSKSSKRFAEIYNYSLK